MTGAGVEGSFGQTQVGTTFETGGAGWLDVSGPYTVGQAVTVTRLNAYVAGGGSASHVRGVIYRDVNGQPGALVAATPETTIAANAAAGWVGLPLSAPAGLTAGSYWLGYWYADGNAGLASISVSGSERYAPSAYSATGSPPASFPAPSTAASSYSLYATYSVTVAPPANTALPQVAGAVQEGETLTASPGTWTGNPSSYAYEWRRCDSGGAACSAIAGATAPTYVLTSADAGQTIRVAVTATNDGGSATAISAATAAVGSSPPANTALPQIAGSAVQGQTLSASTGVWTGNPTSYAYAWERCDSGGASCAPILGASAATYLLLPADVGATLRVAVTATNGSGPATATSDPTALVAAQPNLPANTTPPAITGTAREGQTLSAGTGVWTGSPTSYGYAWQRCDSTGGACTPIAGAAAATYVLVAADAGGTVRVAVTATNGAGSASATSAATAAVLPLAPANSNLPVVSGTAQQGQTLAATTGAWTGSPTGFAYAWQRCDAAGGGCTPILGATATTYLLLPADVGATLRVAVTATNAGGSATATSAATAVVAGAVLDGTFGQTQIGTSRDSGGPGWLDVSGPYAVGQAVTVTRLNAYLSGGGGTANVRGLIYRDSGGQPGALVAATPPTTVAANAAAAWVSMPLSAPVALDAGSYWLGYWYADGNASFAYVTVSGSERYTPTPYSATASPPSSFPAASTSFSSYSLYATYTVTATLPVNTTPPAVTGGTVVGQTLSADNGAWTGSPTSFAYEWRRCDTAGSNCTAIAGATAATYVLAAADTGHTLRVAVTATNASGSAAASSDPTAVVTATAPPPPANTALPAITGTAESGQTLAATQGSWSGSPTSYAYEWRRCDTGGASCTAILGATAASYQLTPSDVDATLRVAVTATNAGGDATAVSAATATVTAPVAGPIAFIRHNVPLGAYDQVTEGNNAGDMDGDGRPDVVVAGDQYVVWYHSTDWAPHVIASGDRFGAGAMVLIEDVNGDGRQDVITGEQANESCSGTCQTDWFENGPTGWTTHVLQTAAYCHDLAWGDLNGDGRPDLACDDQQRERIVWLEHPADPAQAWTVHVIDPQAAMGAQISDIDSDGCLDVVAGEAWYDNVNCDGSTWTRHPYTTLAGPTYPGTPNFTDFEKIVVSDINGDGRPDVAATLFSDNPQGQEWVFLAPQDPLTQSWTAVQLDAGPLFSVHSEVMADFDGSGRPQIAVGESDPGGWSFGANPGTQLNIYEATGNPADASGWQKTTIDVIAAHEMRTADLDGDGHPDLVGDFENTDLLNPPRTGAIHWWENNTDGSAVPPSNPGAPSVVGTAAQGQTLTGWDDGWTGSTPIATGVPVALLRHGRRELHPDRGRDRDDLPRLLGGRGPHAPAPGDRDEHGRLERDHLGRDGRRRRWGGGGAAPANTALPAIAGSAVQGQTLNATTGTWTGSPTGYAYEWQRCDSGGASCTPILGATAASYQLTPSDVDATLRVAVTATNDTGSATALSDPTGTVTALPGAPANTALPAIAGSAVQGARR